MGDMAKKPTKTVRITITLPPDLGEFAVGEADARYGGNVSAAIADAIRDAKERNDSPFAPENALISDIKQTLRKLDLAYERDEKGVDWVVPRLGLGIELKTRFGGGAALERMIAAMAFSVGRGRCTEIVIVGSAAMTEEDAKRFQAAASAFRHCPASFVRIDELPSFLKKRLAEKKLS